MDEQRCLECGADALQLQVTTTRTCWRCSVCGYVWETNEPVLVPKPDRRKTDRWPVREIDAAQ